MIDYTDTYLFNVAKLIKEQKLTSYTLVTDTDPNTIIETLHYHLMNKCQITYTVSVIGKCFEYEKNIKLNITWI